MRIKITGENVLVGDRNYQAGDVLDYAIPDGIKKHLVELGKAEFTEDAAKDDPEGFKAAHLPKVEDKATLFHPVSGLAEAVTGEEFLVTADSEVTANGKPVVIKPAKVKKD